MKLKSTKLGRNMILQCMEGGFSMMFTKIVIGNGDNAGDDAADLSNPLLTIPISSIERNADKVSLVGTYNNNDVAAEFRKREVGVFASFEDDEGETETVLFAYGYADDEHADLIPASGETVLETTERFEVYVSAVENLSAIINESLVTVSKQEFNDHVNNASGRNPHGVTAEDIGLGNVQNASPEDMSVLYEPPADQSLAANTLTPGENLRTALGKLHNIVSQFISHIIEKNPHKIAPGDIGAASASHYHSASQITSGVLSQARGGTGYSSLSSLKAALALEGIGGIKGVVTGSYSGTGAYGSSYRNSLTFTSTPKLLIVMPVSNTSHADYGGFIVLGGTAACRAGGITDDVSNAESQLYFTWGNTVTWYNSSDAFFQQNASGWTYNYFAIL